MKKYVGMNHFPPPENQDKPCRWVCVGGGLYRFGPVTPALAEKLDAREAARTARLAEANVKRAETIDRRRLIDPWRNRA